jgi:hypothetical protein
MHRGLFLDRKGYFYSGEWKEDIKDGFGVFIAVDGYIYEDEWKEGKHRGNGECDGEWKVDNRFHKVIKFKDGSQYAGRWKDDKKDGIGVDTIATGELFIGEWEDGKKNGSGVLISADGIIYEGEWKQGKKHGRGTFEDGFGIYDKQWQNGKKHGYGVCTSPTHTYAARSLFSVFEEFS